MSLQNMARIAKTVRKLEKPRPLKIGNQNRHSTVDGRFLSSVDEIMALVDDVSMNLVNGSYDAALNMKILTLCNYLKANGQQLETIYKDQLDRAFVIFRNGCRDGRLDLRSKMYLLQLIELRGNSWMSSDNLNSYYKPKLNTMDFEMPLGDPVLLGVSPPSNNSPTAAPPPILGPGEVIKTSGKFSKPTKIPGKNYCKDEVVIRNSDSGKVNPGAKERLVQITGPTEEKINYARHLIEDTIKRNASPVRLEHPDKDRIGGSSSSLNSSASDDSNRLTQGVNRSKLLHSYSTNDASLEEYKHTVIVGNEIIRIAGSHPDLVRTAKLVLDDYFYPEQQNALAEDVFLEYESEMTMQSQKTATPAIGSRVGSLDSGATSESEETYKAPLPAQTEANQLVVVRQPLFPDASKEAFEQAELSNRTTDLSARNRRAFFAHTNSQQPSTTEQTSKEETQLISTVKNEPLGRLKILQCGASVHSQKPPADWERLVKEFPAIVKKMDEMYM